MGFISGLIRLARLHKNILKITKNFLQKIKVLQLYNEQSDVVWSKRSDATIKIKLHILLEKILLEK
jgi:hypothetical protein